VPYERAPRHAGRSGWTYLGLWRLALEGITGCTVAPLKVATYAGLAVALFASAFAQLIARTLLFGNPVAGYPSLMTVILFLGGVQLLTLGVIGECLGRVFNETKNRPLYLVERHLPSGLPTPARAIAYGSHLPSPLPSCPCLSRPSTPSGAASKAWMAGTSPAMTNEKTCLEANAIALPSPRAS
jgi:hypothetical protein